MEKEILVKSFKVTLSKLIYHQLLKIQQIWCQ